MKALQKSSTEFGYAGSQVLVQTILGIRWFQYKLVICSDRAICEKINVFIYVTSCRVFLANMDRMSRDILCIVFH